MKCHMHVPWGKTNSISFAIIHKPLNNCFKWSEKPGLYLCYSEWPLCALCNHTVNRYGQMHIIYVTWRYDLMEMASAFLALCAGIHWSTVNSLHNNANEHVLFDASLNELLDKQWSCQWFETPRRSCDVTVMGYCKTNFRSLPHAGANKQ